MIEIATAEHFGRLRLQPMQRAFAALLADEEYVAELAKRESWAAVSGDRVLGIGGFIDQGGGRAHAWALLSAKIGHGFIAVHRAAKQQLDACKFRRVEIFTWRNFCPAHQWASMLGFTAEAELESWFPDGTAGILWKRIKHG